MGSANENFSFCRYVPVRGEWKRDNEPIISLMYLGLAHGIMRSCMIALTMVGFVNNVMRIYDERKKVFRRWVVYGDLWDDCFFCNERVLIWER